MLSFQRDSCAFFLSRLHRPFYMVTAILSEITRCDRGVIGDPYCCPRFVNADATLRRGCSVRCSRGSTIMSRMSSSFARRTMLRNCHPSSVARNALTDCSSSIYRARNRSKLSGECISTCSASRAISVFRMINPGPARRFAPVVVWLPCSMYRWYRLPRTLCRLRSRQPNPSVTFDTGPVVAACRQTSQASTPTRAAHQASRGGRFPAIPVSTNHTSIISERP